MGRPHAASSSRRSPLHAGNRGLKDVLATREHGRERAQAMRARIRPLLRRLIERAQEQGALRRRLHGRGHPARLLDGRPRDRDDRGGRARLLAPLPRAPARRPARRGRDAAAGAAADAGAARAAPRGGGLTAAPDDRLDGARALDGLRRADARHVPGRARPDDRLDRAADDRRRPRRPQPPLVGRDLVPARRRRSRRRSTGSSATCSGASRSSWRRS